MGNDPLDAQTSARLLKRALAIKGSREKLAELLGVHPHDLAVWLTGTAFPPQHIFEKVLEIILDEGKDAAPAEAPPHEAARPRVLIADDPQGCEALAGILGGEFALVQVHTLTDGLDLLQNAAVAKHQSIHAIVCGQHFEGSQMLRFLECVKAYKPTGAIPFICCRATATGLRDGALAAMREACEALGAVAYIDLPERERRAGAETAAVEFRDAVHSAVRLATTAHALRILVVDDNADAAHTLTALLRMAGHDVHKATTGAEALQIGAEVAPQVAILDIGMQDMSGYVLAERVRAQPWGRSTMLIAVTGRSSPEDVARARAAGFDHHFAKPVMLERLLEVLPVKKD